MMMLQIGCLIVGSHDAGKTAVIVRAIMDTFIEGYDPTIDESWRLQRKFEENVFFIELIDAPSHPEYEALLESFYGMAQVLMVCFSLADPASFEYVIQKVRPFLRHAKAGTPIVLVGTKSDLWKSELEIERLRYEHKAPVSTWQIEALAQEIGARTFLCCSAKENEGIEEVLQSVIKSL
ncbi:P-loop containing nucleoside triphosphate hydrolase protein [Flagelloscypha sp. PMI_526]|nr:P-loop containing nucleoside triphosphate hydrolase protein [Flagelloscypha sp. PMI_526]